MKIVEFRGFCKDTDCWKYGSLAEYGLKENIFYQIYSNVGGWYLVDSDSIGQYIGLTDKNGKEIYEGDNLADRYPIEYPTGVIIFEESLLPVVWCEKQLMWCVDASFKKDGSYLTSLVTYFGDNLEVRGNVYENTK